MSGDAPFAVSVIAAPGDLPSAVGRVLAHPAFTLAAVEVPIAADVRRAVTALDDLLPDAVPAAVEIPRDAERDAVLDVLAVSRYRAKLRTGGLRADAFPSPAELAGALRACVTRGVAVKCTAGLHHAVRHTDPVTGFRHHGFLNVLLAVSALVDGASADDVAALLGESDGHGVAAAVRAWTPERAARARGVFTAFGTCSVQEPVDDLVALGLLSLSDRIPS
ncbi:hypothetical protein [Cryptosporangium minutisporangium]|uniref:hypothetical protein n=1 Tax=Cryptosporangium minutisporangium TaxID=113569 RepID=UPI0035E545F8